MKQIIALSLTISMLLWGIFMFFEPQIIKAAADEITVTQDVSSEISIDAGTHVTMSPAIPGITGGTATGTTTWTIITSNAAGFKMELSASADPALAGTTHGDSFDDYTEAVSGVPDKTWSVSNAAEFGYTVFPATPADADQSFKDGAGDLCNVATNNPDGTKCWLGFEGSTKEQIISRSTQTGIGGEAEVVNFKAQLQGSHSLVEDSYTATITATATVN
jgi:hypothetical protein